MRRLPQSPVVSVPISSTDRSRLPVEQSHSDSDLLIIFVEDGLQEVKKFLFSCGVARGFDNVTAELTR
jgi:hypothetical protein